MSSTDLSEPLRPSPDPARRNLRLGLICAGVFVGMIGLAYASVPLYRAFCQVTGFGGTVSQAEAAPTRVLDQSLNIRFDTNVRSLPWTFRSEQVAQSLKIGETGLAFFAVTNNGATPMTGRAVYNVVPEAAGAYFRKLECFCFSDQTIGPGETIKFPMVYFVDPEYADDFETRNKAEITLSYTFYPSSEDAAVQPVAHAPATPAASPLGGSQGAGL
ncbi:cytochrome c oxidase assembly protein [Phenylobacterium sp.]|uniref:cytochrome c oxidase assembly protein n=1 Tax=Phenylobacterium sp. TaxID=1871053 RepID=UPI0027304B19|nr:cytochrome c oxidase assembly protein [Phenylobacterium sp.]MDP2212559.1 cytochrome c oxidase assembly protein [Phenylobacterium sp.]